MPRTFQTRLESSNPIITDGANLSELGVLFMLPRKEVARRIEGTPPMGRRGGVTTWRVSDVAAKLIKLDDSMSDLIGTVLTMHHNDLPKMLAKEFWMAQNQRLRYLKDTGDLWDTQAVVELASEVFKTLRLSLMLAADAIERETGLTVRQREIVEDLMHAALNEAREKLVADLIELRKNTSGKAFAPEEGQRSSKRGTNGHADPARLDEWGDPITEDADDL